MVTPRTSSNGWFGSASAAARPLLPAGTALMPPAPGNTDFEASVEPLAISCFLPPPLSLFLCEASVSSAPLSNNNLDGFHKLVYAPHWTPAPRAAHAQSIPIAGARKRRMRSRETIRVGAGAGTSDDRMVPALELAEHGDIDYLVFECLAERTVSRENLARSKDPELGYSPSLHARLRMVLPTCIRKGIRIVSNMGAANPLGGARAARKEAADLGLGDVAVAVVLGGDVSSIVQHRGELTLTARGGA